MYQIRTIINGKNKKLAITLAIAFSANLDRDLVKTDRENWKKIRLRRPESSLRSLKFSRSYILELIRSLYILIN